ncbi:thioredoxin domain-containing protein [Elusimicrobiota bacterium]
MFAKYETDRKENGFSGRKFEDIIRILQVELLTEGILGFSDSKDIRIVPELEVVLGEIEGLKKYLDIEPGMKIKKYSAFRNIITASIAVITGLVITGVVRAEDGSKAWSSPFTPLLIGFGILLAIALIISMLPEIREFFPTVSSDHPGKRKAEFKSETNVKIEAMAHRAEGIRDSIRSYYMHFELNSWKEDEFLKLGKNIKSMDYLGIMLELHESKLSEFIKSLESEDKEKHKRTLDEVASIINEAKQEAIAFNEFMNDEKLLAKIYSAFLLDIINDAGQSFDFDYIRDIVSDKLFENKILVESRGATIINPVYERVYSRVKGFRTYYTNDITEARKNFIAEEYFLRENRGREGVIETKDGIQFVYLRRGEGIKPALTSKVRINYRGTLLNGTEFDSSYKRGNPNVFRLDKLIPGWQKVLTEVGTGSIVRIFIPSAQGYGEKGIGPIPPNATLVFDIELLAVPDVPMFMDMVTFSKEQRQKLDKKYDTEGVKPDSDVLILSFPELDSEHDAMILYDAALMTEANPAIVFTTPGNSKRFMPVITPKGFDRLYRVVYGKPADVMFKSVYTDEKSKPDLSGIGDKSLEEEEPKTIVIISDTSYDTFQKAVSAYKQLVEMDYDPVLVVQQPKKNTETAQKAVSSIIGEVIASKEPVQVMTFLRDSSGLITIEDKEPALLEDIMEEAGKGDLLITEKSLEPVLKSDVGLTRVVLTAAMVVILGISSFVASAIAQMKDKPSSDTQIVQLSEQEREKMAAVLDGVITSYVKKWSEMQYIPEDGSEGTHEVFKSMIVADLFSGLAQYGTFYPQYMEEIQKELQDNGIIPKTLLDEDPETARYILLKYLEDESVENVFTVNEFDNAIDEFIVNPIFKSMFGVLINAGYSKDAKEAVRGMTLAKLFEFVFSSDPAMDQIISGMDNQEFKDALILNYDYFKHYFPAMGGIEIDKYIPGMMVVILNRYLAEKGLDPKTMLSEKTFPALIVLQKLFGTSDKLRGYAEISYPEEFNNTLESIIQGNIGRFGILPLKNQADYEANKDKIAQIKKEVVLKLFSTNLVYKVFRNAVKEHDTSIFTTYDLENGIEEKIIADIDGTYRQSILARYFGLKFEYINDAIQNNFVSDHAAYTFKEMGFDLFWLQANDPLLVKNILSGYVDEKILEELFKHDKEYEVDSPKSKKPAISIEDDTVTAYRMPELIKQVITKNDGSSKWVSMLSLLLITGLVYTGAAFADINIAAGYMADKVDLSGLHVAGPALTLVGTMIFTGIAGSRKKTGKKDKPDILQMDDSNYDKIIKMSYEKPVLLLVTFPGGTNCEYVETAFDKVAEKESEKAVFVKINGRSYLHIVRRYDIDRAPSMVLIEDGKPVDYPVSGRPSDRPKDNLNYVKKQLAKAKKTPEKKSGKSVTAAVVAFIAALVLYPMAAKSQDVTGMQGKPLTPQEELQDEIEKLADSMAAQIIYDLTKLKSEGKNIENNYDIVMRNFKKSAVKGEMQTMLIKRIAEKLASMTDDDKRIEELPGLNKKSAEFLEKQAFIFERPFMDRSLKDVPASEASVIVFLDHAMTWEKKGSLDAIQILYSAVEMSPNIVSAYNVFIKKAVKTDVDRRTAIAEYYKEYKTGSDEQLDRSYNTLRHLARAFLGLEQAPVKETAEKIKKYTDAKFVVELTPSNIDGVMEEAQKEGKLLVVDFWAPWCQPCKVIEPAFITAAQMFGKVAVFAQTDVDKYAEFANRFKIEGIPYIGIIKDKKIAGRFQGLPSYDQNQTIDVIRELMINASDVRTIDEPQQEISKSSQAGLALWKLIAPLSAGLLLLFSAVLELFAEVTVVDVITGSGSVKDMLKLYLPATVLVISITTIVIIITRRTRLKPITKEFDTLENELEAISNDLERIVDRLEKDRDSEIFLELQKLVDAVEKHELNLNGRFEKAGSSEQEYDDGIEGSGIKNQYEYLKNKIEKRDSKYFSGFMNGVEIKIQEVESYLSTFEKLTEPQNLESIFERFINGKKHEISGHHPDQETDDTYIRDILIEKGIFKYKRVVTVSEDKKIYLNIKSLQNYLIQDEIVNKLSKNIVFDIAKIDYSDLTDEDIIGTIIDNYFNFISEVAIDIKKSDRYENGISRLISKYAFSEQGDINVITGAERIIDAYLAQKAARPDMAKVISQVARIDKDAMESLNALIRDKKAPDDLEYEDYIRDIVRLRIAVRGQLYKTITLAKDEKIDDEIIIKNIKAVYALATGLEVTNDAYKERVEKTLFKTAGAGHFFKSGQEGSAKVIILTILLIISGYFGFQFLFSGPSETDKERGRVIYSENRDVYESPKLVLLDNIISDYIRPISGRKGIRPEALKKDFIEELFREAVYSNPEKLIEIIYDVTADPELKKKALKAKEYFKTNFSYKTESAVEVEDLERLGILLSQNGLHPQNVAQNDPELIIEIYEKYFDAGFESAVFTETGSTIIKVILTLALLVGAGVTLAFVPHEQLAGLAEKAITWPYSIGTIAVGLFILAGLGLEIKDIGKDIMSSDSRIKRAINMTKRHYDFLHWVEIAILLVSAAMMVVPMFVTGQILPFGLEKTHLNVALWVIQFFGTIIFLGSLGYVLSESIMDLRKASGVINERLEAIDKSLPQMQDIVDNIKSDDDGSIFLELHDVHQVAEELNKQRMSDVVTISAPPMIPEIKIDFEARIHKRSWEEYKGELKEYKITHFDEKIKEIDRKYREFDLLYTAYITSTAPGQLNDILQKYIENNMAVADAFPEAMVYGMYTKGIFEIENGVVRIAPEKEIYKNIPNLKQFIIHSEQVQEFTKWMIKNPQTAQAVFYSSFVTEGILTDYSIHVRDAAKKIKIEKSDADRISAWIAEFIDTADAKTVAAVMETENIISSFIKQDTGRADINEVRDLVIKITGRAENMLRGISDTELQGLKAMMAADILRATVAVRRLGQSEGSLSSIL